MKNILVTIDFNTDEKLLIDKALQLAKSFDSKIWLMHVAAPEPDFVGYTGGSEYFRDERAADLRKEHKQIQEYAENIKQKGIKAEGLLIQGTTVEMILLESTKLNVDLIIIGHHEHGFFYKAFLGSVSEAIIKKSKIPVLMVPLE